MSARKKRTTKQTFTHLPKYSSLNLKKDLDNNTDWSLYFKCKTLVWKGSTAEGLYKFFLLLFSISFVHASQNYKILVGEMQKARFHIPEDLFPCAVYKPGDHPGKSGKHDWAHQCCNHMLAALLHQRFALCLLGEVATKPYKRPRLRQDHLYACSETILTSSSAFSLVPSSDAVLK